MRGEIPPISFVRVLDLPATFADTRGRHCVSIDPTLALGSDVDSAAVYPVWIDFAAHFTNSDLLEASTAFLVRYDNSSCDATKGNIASLSSPQKSLTSWFLELL